MGGGLISGRNLRGARELLFKFAMLAVAVTPSRHVIRITTTIIPPVSSGINARVCTLERERERESLSSYGESFRFVAPCALSIADVSKSKTSVSQCNAVRDMRMQLT